jgi:hypothetical protein
MDKSDPQARPIAIHIEGDCLDNSISNVEGHGNVDLLRVTGSMKGSKLENFALVSEPVSKEMAAHKTDEPVQGLRRWILPLLKIGTLIAGWIAK